MRLGLAAVLIGCLFCGASWAEIALELEVETLIPWHSPWDLQFVEDELTPAWVWAETTTVHWVYPAGADEQQYTLPDSLLPEFCYGATAEQVAWVKLPAAPDHPAVMAGFSGKLAWEPPWCFDGYSEKYVFCLIDLQEQAVIDTAYFSVSYRNPEYDDYTTTTVGQSACWPPLPDTTHSVLVWLRFANNWWGFNRDRYTWWSELHRFTITTNGIGHFHHGEGGPVSFFRDLPQPEVAYGRGYTFFSVSEDWPPDTNYYRHAHIGVRNFALNTHRADSTHDSLAVAQQDADGTKRILAIEGQALDATNFAELWQNPAITGELFAARMAPGTDELFFSRSGGRTLAYRGTDGSFVDTLAPFLGRAQWAIKQETRSDALVTLQNTLVYQPKTLRLYRLQPPRVHNLLCYYDSDLERVVLHWESAPGAVAYRVWMSPVVDDWGQQIAEVDASVQSIGFVPPMGARFFHVTVEY